MLLHGTANYVREKTDLKDNERYCWMIVRTLPGDERKLQTMLQQHIRLMLDMQHCPPDSKNILEVYNPVRSAASARTDGSREADRQLFACHVFVLATHRALSKFLEAHYPYGHILYDRKVDPTERATVWTVPEAQLRFFREFNENYADKVVVLERPYTDYAFNPKTSMPNATIKVLDGPLRGRVGYLTRFRRDRRLVFNIRNPYGRGYMAVAIPEIWNFNCVLLHNAHNDPLTIGTSKARAADLLADLIVSAGYTPAQATPLLVDIVRRLAQKPYITGLREQLRRTHRPLAEAMERLTPAQAELVLALARYERDNPGYVWATWRQVALRPFLTPTNFQRSAVVRHADFTELVLPMTFVESTYNHDTATEASVSVTYYAHIGIVRKGGGYVAFANWNDFLAAYFSTCGHAHNVLLGGTTARAADTAADGAADHERLMESFRNFAPTLYTILSGSATHVSAVQNFRVGQRRVNVMAATLDAATADEALHSPIVATLADTCLRVCREIATSTHLAIWRRYLTTVWLHE